MVGTLVGSLTALTIDGLDIGVELLIVDLSTFVVRGLGVGFGTIMDLVGPTVEGLVFVVRIFVLEISGFLIEVFFISLVGTLATTFGLADGSLIGKL